MPLRYLSFGGTSLAGFTDTESDMPLGPVADSFLVLANGGAWDGYGSDPAPPTVTPITLKGWLEAADGAPNYSLDVMAQYKIVQNLGGKAGRLIRQWPDGTVEWVVARCMSRPDKRMLDTGSGQPVQLDFRSGETAWHGTHHGTPWDWDDGPTDNPPGFVWDSGQAWDEVGSIIITNGVPFTLTNGGTGPVTDLTLIFNPIVNGLVAAPILGFTLTQTGVIPVPTLQYFGNWVNNNGPSMISQTLTLDVGAAAVTLDTAGDYQSLDDRAAPPPWFTLAPGVNTFIAAWRPTSITTMPLRAIFSDGGAW